MTDRVLRLDIRPLITYSDGKKRRTTLTSFEEVLKTKEDGLAVTEEDIDKTGRKSAEDTVEDKAASCFRDPLTGRAVRYVDVADPAQEPMQADPGQDVEKVSADDRTTTADSMKKTKYDSIFKEAADKYHVSESLLKAIAKAESDFNASDVSSAGAIGVMQLMPETAKGLGVSDPYDPEQNIMGGARYISQKLKEFNGDERQALAAYNAGSGAVRRCGGVPSYCKTYVSRVQSYKKAFETAASL